MLIAMFLHYSGFSLLQHFTSPLGEEMDLTAKLRPANPTYMTLLDFSLSHLSVFSLYLFKNL